MTQAGKRVLLVIGGGIAAYKSLDLIRRLRERGFSVRCVMTEAAAHFVTPLSVGTVAADLTYKEVLSGLTHHAAYFRLQIEDTVVNGMDYILLDADGKIAEVIIWWRPLPSGVQMQRHLAGLLGMKPWELLTHT